MQNLWKIFLAYIAVSIARFMAFMAFEKKEQKFLWKTSAIADKIPQQLKYSFT